MALLRAPVRLCASSATSAAPRRPRSCAGPGPRVTSGSLGRPARVHAGRRSAVAAAAKLTTSKGKILGLNGQELILHGINWFGFEVGQTMVDGLFAGNDTLTLDFATVVYRLKLLGFNAVRLPFSFVDVYDTVPKSFTRNCTTVSKDDVIRQTTAPGVTPRNPAPDPKNPPSSPPGTCNAYLPNDTTLNRFLWVVNYFASQDMYVVLDNQFNLDQTAIRDQGKWVSRWADLIRQLTVKYPDAAERVLVDVLNEPDAWNVTWAEQHNMTIRVPEKNPANWPEVTSASLPAMGELYLQAMDAVYSENQGVLFVVEGCGQWNLAKNWGDGLATDPALVSPNNGVSDPNPFFNQLIQRPYINQVIIGVHVYPPSVSTAQNKTQGPDLYKRYSQSYGYLNKQGYCTGSNTLGSPSGDCHVFPVVYGETGSGFNDVKDEQPMKDQVLYYNNTDGAADGLHNPLQGFFWWAWNSNAGQNMGLVKDWSTIDWDKVEYLEKYGLKPWYR